jgi:y4mF family transcriptional regulator
MKNQNTKALSKAAEIGALVRNLRQKAKLTQLELARLAGVGKTAVFDIEKGKASVRLNTILQVLEALNVELQLVNPLQQ